MQLPLTTLGLGLPAEVAVTQAVNTVNSVISDTVIMTSCDALLYVKISRRSEVSFRRLMMVRRIVADGFLRNALFHVIVL